MNQLVLVSISITEENESEAGPGESNCRNSTISTRMLLIFHPCQEEELSFGRITTRMLIYFILLLLATPFVLAVLLLTYKSKSFVSTRYNSSNIAAVVSYGKRLHRVYKLEKIHLEGQQTIGAGRKIYLQSQHSDGIPRMCTPPPPKRRLLFIHSSKRMSYDV